MRYYISGTKYPPLGLGLLEYLSPRQKEAICKKLNEDTAVVHESDIIRYFRRTRREYEEDARCVCGVEICEVWYLKNKQTYVEVKIGSKCIQKSYNNDPKKLGIQHAPTPCLFCKKWTTKLDEDQLFIMYRRTKAKQPTTALIELELLRA